MKNTVTTRYVIRLEGEDLYWNGQLPSTFLANRTASDIKNNLFSRPLEHRYLKFYGDMEKVQSALTSFHVWLDTQSQEHRDKMSHLVIEEHIITETVEISTIATKTTDEMKRLHKKLNEAVILEYFEGGVSTATRILTKLNKQISKKKVPIIPRFIGIVKHADTVHENTKAFRQTKTNFEHIWVIGSHLFVFESLGDMALIAMFGIIFDHTIDLSTA